MARVTGIGGIFFKADDPDGIRAWYREHLGIVSDEYGWTFRWRDDPHPDGFTVWSPFKRDTAYFDPSDQPFMVNFRVDDLDAMLDQLRAAGVWVDEKIDESEFGRFGWILDPAGVRVELWEPPAA